jgi:uncharacterized protein (DUF885 family)
MAAFSHRALFGFALLALSGCGAPPVPSPVQAPKAAAPDQIGRIVDRYWDEHILLQNAISPQSLADSLDLERHSLAELLSVPRDRLDFNAKLTFDIFKRQRELAIEGFTYPAELLPVDPFGGMPLQLAALAAATDQQPLLSSADYENWLRRIDEYVRWTQQAMINMQEGIRRGYTEPKVVVERMLPVLERLGAENSDNVFFAPLRTMPASIKDPERTRLTNLVSGAIKEKLLPANRRLHDFLQQEYLPRCRSGVAIADLPLGTAWYAYRMKRAIGTSQSPAEVHRIGVTEVERLRGRAQAAHETTALAPDELLKAYKDLAVQVSSSMPKLFSDEAKSDLEIVGVAGLPILTAPLLYHRGGPNGAPPDLLYVDVADKAPRLLSVASFLQQAMPGQYYQFAVQQQQIDLPKFRRLGSEPAFTEGWGLYAASLAEELGIETDAAKLDAVALQMRCAVALVVDTGLHAQGWTRAQAIEYIQENLSEESDSAALVDWYVANPADGLACSMGEQKLRALKLRAQQALGSRFELREFHSSLLKDGAMPLDILEGKMKAWSDAAR